MKSEDIAKIVGVSRSTVSRVLNNYSNVPEETRLKVMEAVEKYNYTPNALARTLAGKRTETIGVFFIVESKTEVDAKLVYNDFYTTYLEAIVDIANKKGYYVLIQTIFKASDYAKISKAFREKRIDGGLLIGTRSESLDLIDIDSIAEPLIIFDYEADVFEKNHKKQDVTILNAMDKEASKQAVKYLYDLGHRKIGFIKGVESTLSARKRFEGYQEACKDFGLEADQNYILEGFFDQEVTFRAVELGIKNRSIADSYICANDYMAIAAIDCFQSHGINVPNEVSIIGFDNTRTGELMNTKLTTFTPDFYEMTKRAIDIIHLSYESPSMVFPKVIDYKVKLIQRNSAK